MHYKYVVVCKNCGREHSYEGWGDNVASREIEGGVSVYCPSAGHFIDYKEEETCEVGVPPMSSAGSEELIEIRDRLAKLEAKFDLLQEHNKLQLENTKVELIKSNEALLEKLLNDFKESAAKALADSQKHRPYET
jgi:hypothetical protein